ncbi:thioesterase [Anaerotignum faecicola]|nr:thioesterase [Anaerotignum faecicola]
MGYYEEQKEISYYEVNNRLCLKPASLATLFQDLAIRHSDSLGYTIELLLKENRGWIITNWHIDVLRYPKCGEKIKLRTWASSTKKILAERSYTVLDDGGSEIIRANSRWVFMDLEKRKPVFVSEEMQKAYESGLEAAIAGEKYKMPKVSEGSLISRSTFVVKRSETDTNGHANNVQYIAWAMDCVPDGVYYNGFVSELKVAYRRECYRGSRVIAKTYKCMDGEDTEIITAFCGADDESVIYSEVVSVWKGIAQ